MTMTSWYRSWPALLLLAAGPAAASPPVAPQTLTVLRAPDGRWIAERRFLDDAWRGRIVSVDGLHAFDLGAEVYPIGWSVKGDTLQAVRLVDDGHELIEARCVSVVGPDWSVVDVPGTAMSAMSALAAWRTAYLGGGASTADVEERRGSPLTSNSAPRKVCIDPGHGGLGAGTWNANNGDGAGSHGPNGLTEQWVNLRVAQLLLQDLDRDPRFAGCFLTRSSSTQQVSLADRVALAAQAGADFYLSIHHNGLPTGAPNRTETYYCRQNSSCGDELPAGSALPGEDCHDMAWRLHDRIVGAFGYTPRGAFEDSAGTGRFHFHVLRQASMPAVLTEASNLNDPVEEGLFGSDPLERHAKKEAVALHLGLIDLAVGSTGLPVIDPPTRDSPPLDPPVIVQAARRNSRGGLDLSVRSRLGGLHTFSLVDPLGRRLIEFEPFQGPGEVSVTSRAGIAFPVWFLVRHGGTIVAVRRLP